MVRVYCVLSTSTEVPLGYISCMERRFNKQNLNISYQGRDPLKYEIVLYLVIIAMIVLCRHKGVED